MLRTVRSVTVYGAVSVSQEMRSALCVQLTRCYATEGFYNCYSVRRPTNAKPTFGRETRASVPVFAPPGVEGLLHAWFGKDCSLRSGLRPAPFVNALEIREQTSQAHSLVGVECACEVCSRISKALANGAGRKFLPMCVPCVQQAEIAHVAAQAAALGELQLGAGWRSPLPPGAPNMCSVNAPPHVGVCTPL